MAWVAWRGVRIGASVRHCSVSRSIASTCECAAVCAPLSPPATISSLPTMPVGAEARGVGRLAAAGSVLHVLLAMSYTSTAVTASSNTSPSAAAFDSRPPAT